MSQTNSEAVTSQIIDIEEYAKAEREVPAHGQRHVVDAAAYTVERLRAESIKRSDPTVYAELRRSKYIDGVEETRPAVVSVNTEFAGMMVNEMLARLHPYRLDDNSQFAVVRRSLAQMETYCERGDENAERTFIRQVGRGDVRPLLEMPELSEVEVSR